MLPQRQYQYTHTEVIDASSLSIPKFVSPASRTQIYPYLDSLNKQRGDFAFGMSQDKVTFINALESESFEPPIFYELNKALRVDKFNSLQKWEGHVIQVTQSSFIANLFDLTAKVKTEEEAEFPIEDVDPNDRDLIKPGSIFYWNIGYYDKTSGRSKESLIRFRRLPTWNKFDISLAKQRAKAIKEAIDGHTT